MTIRIITYSFYLLFFLTPLFFLKYNSELFEYNKMMLVYTLTTIITATWVFRMVTLKKLMLKRTPLDIPLMIFLASQILSTIFSMDVHTSLLGYYSRSNGGLLSLISYILLFYALVSNFEKQKALQFLKVAVWGGVAVSLYAIPEHFGVSPSCIVLTGEFSANCWVQDVQARVFATLGQPNWLAAYLSMLIFPSLYFALSATKKNSIILYLLFSILIYAAFTFTFSRGATLGLIAGGLVFISAWVYQNKLWKNPLKQLSHASQQKILFSILGVFILVNLLYGSALTRFKLFSSTSSTPAQQQAAQKQEAAQLEVGGTESGAIRLIVWQGALDIFKHYPIFGSGVETFAYSYYNFRPVSHNLVSEWDFLYNKAHNEYLNYLATTGLFGFLAYLSVIVTFIFWCIRYYVSCIKGKNNKSLTTNYQLLTTSLLASYTAFLVQNIFGFSVVVIALFFFTFPALILLATGSLKDLKLPSHLLTASHLLQKTIYRKKLFTTLTLTFIVLTAGLTVYKLVVFWTADVFYKNGSDYSDSGSPVKGYRLLSLAARLNPTEPLYRSDLGFASSGYAVLALDQGEATAASLLKDEAVYQTQKALQISPKNTSIRRTAFQTYYQLSLSYPELEQKAIEAVDDAIKLAPTDAKLFYNKGLVLSQMGKKDEALSALNKAVELKPNYREARFSKAVILFDKGEKNKAKNEMQEILKFIHNDPDVLEKLKEWGDQG